jgi:hypothetical protein
MIMEIDEKYQKLKAKYKKLKSDYKYIRKNLKMECEHTTQLESEILDINTNTIENNNKYNLN